VLLSFLLTFCLLYMSQNSAKHSCSSEGTLPKGHQILPKCTKYHQSAPESTKLHQPKPECTRMHRSAPEYTRVHQSVPNCNTLHLTAINCTKVCLFKPICTGRDILFSLLDQILSAKFFSKISKHSLT
jgi:hypothetical protein